MSETDGQGAADGDAAATERGVSGDAVAGVEPGAVEVSVGDDGAPGSEQVGDAASAPGPGTPARAPGGAADGAEESKATPRQSARPEPATPATPATPSSVATPGTATSTRRSSRRRRKESQDPVGGVSVIVTDEEYTAACKAVEELPNSAIKDFLDKIRCGWDETAELRYTKLADHIDLLCVLLRRAKALKRLRLMNNSIGVELTERLATAVVDAPALTQFELAGGAFRGDEAEAWGNLCSALARSRRIHVVHIVETPMGSDEGAVDAVCKLLTTNKSINDLDLSRTDIAGPACEKIGIALTQNSTLRKLCLKNNLINVFGMRGMARALTEGSNELRVLNLHGNPIGDEGIHLLAEALMRADVLHVLDISSCFVRSAGAHDIGRMLRVDLGLYFINLMDNDEIRDKGAFAIAKGLHWNRGLKNLYLGNTGMTIRGARAIAAAIACGGGADDLQVAPVDDEELDGEFQAGYAARDHFKRADTDEMPLTPTKSQSSIGPDSGGGGGGTSAAPPASPLGAADTARSGAPGDGKDGGSARNASANRHAAQELEPLDADGASVATEHRSFGMLAFANGDVLEVREIDGPIGRGTFYFSQTLPYAGRAVVLATALLSWVDYLADVAVLIYLAVEGWWILFTVSLILMLASVSHTVYSLVKEGRPGAAVLQLLSLGSIADAMPVVLGTIRKDVAVDVLSAVPMVGTGSVSRLKLQEALIESGPQGILQAFILLTQGFNEIVAISAAVSILSVGVGLAAADRMSFQEAARRRLGRNARISWFSGEFLLLSAFRISEGASRILLSALVFVAFGAPVFCVAAALSLALQWALWELGGKKRSLTAREHLAETDFKKAGLFFFKDIQKILASLLVFPGFHHMCQPWLQSERQMQPGWFLVERTFEQVVCVVALVLFDPAAPFMDIEIADVDLFSTVRLSAFIITGAAALGAFLYWHAFNDDVLLSSIKYHRNMQPVHEVEHSMSIKLTGAGSSVRKRGSNASV